MASRENSHHRSMPNSRNARRIRLAGISTTLSNAGFSGRTRLEDAAPATRLLDRDGTRSKFGAGLAHPFGPRVLPMSPVRTVTHVSGTDHSKWRGWRDCENAVRRIFVFG